MDKKKTGRAPKIRQERLSNGLEVLFLEKHDLPVVTSLLCYDVGSRDEGRGETGISHFLEHMMFKGTRRLRRGEIDLVTSRLGGMNNAMTSEDSTCYLFRVASDRWEKVLEIEADRMQGCLLAPKEFEQEKKVVLEELRMGRDDPWHQLYHAVEAAAYQVHPYHHPIIGWEEDLVRLERERMMEFYRRHYSPERATLVLVGDLDPAAALPTIRRQFGRLKVTGQPRPPAPSEPPQEGERRIAVRAPGSITRLALAWKGVRLADPREPELDILAGILGGGRTSRLYRRLVQGEELASSVAVFNESRLDPGLFWVLVDLKEGADPGAVEAAVKEEAARLCARPPGRRELDRARARIETSLHFGAEETYGAAMRIGEYAMSADLAALHRYPTILAGADPAFLRARAREILNPDALTVGLSLPADSATAGGSPRRGAARAVPVRRQYRRGDWRFPPIRRASLDNGLQILAVRSRAAPVVSVLCSVEGGQEFAKPAKAGVGALVGATLAEGTRRRSGEALAELVESRGGFLSTGAEGVAVRMHARDLEQAVGITAEVTRQPAFPKTAVDRLKAITVSEIRGELEHPRAVASQRFREEVYGGHPLHLPLRGHPQTVTALTPADLRRWHERLYVPGRAVVAVVGDVDPRAAVDAVAARFGGWRGRTPAPPKLPPLERRPGGGSVFLPMDREQVHLYLGHLGVTRTHPDYYALLVMDHILGTGPGFTDRISRKLRDQMGLAYHVTASITGTARRLPGFFAAYIATSPENKEAAQAGFLEEIRRLRRRRPTAAEVAGVHDYLTGSFYLALEKSAAVARFLVGLERFGLGDDYLQRYPDLIRAQDPGRVVEAARAHLHPDDMVTVWAGPEAGDG